MNAVDQLGKVLSGLVAMLVSVTPSWAVDSSVEISLSFRASKIQSIIDQVSFPPDSELYSVAFQNQLDKIPGDVRDANFLDYDDPTQLRMAGKLLISEVNLFSSLVIVYENMSVDFRKEIYAKTLDLLNSDIFDKRNASHLNKEELIIRFRNKVISVERISRVDYLKELLKNAKDESVFK